MHQRRIIREAVADYLNANVAPLAGRVFKSREAPANVASLLAEGPMANVYTRKDSVKEKDAYPASGFDSGVYRTLELCVEITATGAWTVDDKLDDLADDVETLLENFEIPGLPSAEVRLHETQIDSTDEFDAPLGGALLHYEIRYWRPYRTDTSEQISPCGGTISVIANGTPAEALPACDCDPPMPWGTVPTIDATNGASINLADGVLTLDQATAPTVDATNGAPVNLADGVLTLDLAA